MSKIAVVTGANRGIGLQLSKDLIGLGYFVVMGTRNIDMCQKEMSEIDPSLYLILEVDISISQTVKIFGDVIKSKFGQVDLLINNAAIYLDEHENLFDQKEEVVEKTIQTNLLGPFYVTKNIVPAMKSNGGIIINISSGAAQLDSIHKGTGAYRISKLGLNGMTIVLADELKEFNIDVFSVCPGWVRTQMGGDDADLSVEEASTGILKLITGTHRSGKLYKNGKIVSW